MCCDKCQTIGHKCANQQRPRIQQEEQPRRRRREPKKVTYEWRTKENVAATTELVAIATEAPGDQSRTAQQSQGITQDETQRISQLKEARVPVQSEMHKDKAKEVSSPTLNLINFSRLSPSTSRNDKVDSRRNSGVSRSLPHDRGEGKNHTQ